MERPDGCVHQERQRSPDAAGAQGKGAACAVHGAAGGDHHERATRYQRSAVPSKVFEWIPAEVPACVGELAQGHRDAGADVEVAQLPLSCARKNKKE